MSLSLLPKHCQEPCHCTDLQGRKQGGKHAGENLAILDRTHLHKHGTLSPESLHAESQWGQPERVGQEVHRSELGDLIPGVIHRPLPHAKMVAERPCSCVNSTNVGSGPKPLPPNWTRSITFEWHTLLRNNSKHLGIWKAFFFFFLRKWTNKTNDKNKYRNEKPYQEEINE